MGILFQLPFYM